MSDLALRFWDNQQLDWTGTGQALEGGDLAWYRAMQAAYRGDEATDYLFEAFVRDFPTHHKIDEARLAYLVFLVQQKRDSETFRLLEALNWYTLSMPQAQLFHYLKGRLLYPIDSLIAVGYWQQAASVQGEFQVHARYSMMLDKLHRSDIEGVMELLDLLQADKRYESLCIYPKALSLALDGDSMTALTI
ncbi:MAG: hypothetical protein ACKO2X_08240, partial [Bacteroidota bacterium]